MITHWSSARWPVLFAIATLGVTLSWPSEVDRMTPKLREQLALDLETFDPLGVLRHLDGRNDVRQAELERPDGFRIELNLLRLADQVSWGEGPTLTLPLIYVGPDLSSYYHRSVEGATPPRAGLVRNKFWRSPALRLVNRGLSQCDVFLFGNGNELLELRAGEDRLPSFYSRFQSGSATRPVAISRPA